MNRDNKPVEANRTAAKEAGLRYVSDSKTGIRYDGNADTGFAYCNPDGSEVTDEKVATHQVHRISPGIHQHVVLPLYQ